MADNNEMDIKIGGDASGVDTASKQATAAVKGVSTEARQLDAAFRRLKSSIDPTFAATEKYNKTLADNQRLLQAGRISQEEYAAGARAAKAALDAQVQSLNANSAAAKAAAAAKRQAEQQALAQQKTDEQAAAREARRLAQEKRQAEIQAAKEAAAAVRAAKAEERRVAREAAEEVKRLAREKAAAERKASQEAAAAERAAKAEQRRAAREAAEEARRASAEKRAADRAATEAAREHARQTRDYARAEREAAQAVRELRGSVDPAFAAQERYNDTMRRATALLMQNKLQQGEWIAIQRQAAAQMDINVRSLGRMNSVYVQLGYQAQDVTASLASGINPLVILAQQGGQTAAALSMMGGTAGRVASFFAGPWGAAIIGATMLLGFYIQRTKESEQTTKDATNAEDLRRMKLQELVQVLREYNAEQREANLNTYAQRQLKVAGAITQINEATQVVANYQRRLADARAELKLLLENPFLDESGIATVLARRQVSNLENQLKSAQEGEALARSSLAQARLSQLTANAAAAVDEREAVRMRYEEEETRLQQVYSQRVVAANQIQDAAARQAAINQAEADFTRSLTAEKQKQQEAEEAISKARRASSEAGQRRAAREAASLQKEQLQDLVESYTYEQTLAGENYQEILRLQDLKIEALTNFHGAQSKEVLRAQRERVVQERQLQSQLLVEQQLGIEARLAAQEAQAGTKNSVARIGVESKGDATGFLQGIGAINDNVALAQKEAQLQQMYQLEVDYENRIFNLKMNALRERLSLENLPAKQKAEIQAQIEGLEAQHQQRLTVMAAENTRQTIQIHQQAATQIANKWREVATTISGSLRSSFQGIWTYSMTWQEAMFNLADQLTYKFVDAGLKILEDWIVQQAMKTGVTQAATTVETATVVAGETAKTAATSAGTAARVGVTAAGTAATTGMTVTSALASIGADAARAAAGAYAAIAGIPVIGPFLAPAAAGAALVAVMALGSRIASARGGQWQVPQDGQITELHRDEMVLPAWAAKPLRANLSAPSSAGMMGRAAAAGSSARTANDNLTEVRGGDTHVWRIQAMDAKSFQKFLEDNPRALQGAMKKQVRNNLGRN